MRVSNVSVQLLQNESPSMIAMVITYVALRNDYKRANVIQLIANTPFPTANTTICHIHICSVILIDINYCDWSCVYGTTSVVSAVGCLNASVQDAMEHGIPRDIIKTKSKFSHWYSSSLKYYIRKKIIFADVSKRKIKIRLSLPKIFLLS
jgi:hypothetical protein